MRVIKLRRPLLLICAILGVSAAALWAVYFAVGLSPHWDRADLGGAITMTQLGGTVFTVRLCRDRDKQLLMRSLVEVSQRAAKAQTAPQPQLPEPQGAALRVVGQD